MNYHVVCRILRLKVHIVMQMRAINVSLQSPEHCPKILMRPGQSFFIFSSFLVNLLFWPAAEDKPRYTPISF